MRLRRFTEVGISRFDDFRASSLQAVDQLHEILRDDACSESVSTEIEVEQQRLPTRFSVGEYLHGLLDDVTAPGVNIDVGTWTWLSAFYFAQLCPQGSSPGDRPRWVPAMDNYRQYYRHLLAGPYLVYRAHSDNPHRAMALLANPPHQPGDIAEQLASRQELVTNPSVMEVATRLYINTANNSPKRGAAGRGPGSARRLAAVLNQLDLTWDLYGLDPDKLLDLLPEEFDQFKP